MYDFLYKEHGKSIDLKRVTDRGQFMEEFLKACQAERPVLVAASMGGSYALPYIMNPRANTCDRRARGFVSIAIVGTDRFKNSQYNQCHVSTALSWSFASCVCQLTIHPVFAIDVCKRTITLHSPEVTHS